MGRLLRKDEVTAELSTFLEAIPYQVEAWDSEVVDGLMGNASEFDQFKNSDDFRKWEIYNRYRK